MKTAVQRCAYKIVSEIRGPNSRNQRTITMKQLSALRVHLVVTFFCVLLISLVNCDARTSQNDSDKSIADPNSSIVNTPQQERDSDAIKDIVTLLQLLEKNYDQPEAENKQVSRHHATPDVSDDEVKNKLAMFNDHLADAKPDDSRRLNRRSASRHSHTQTESSKSTEGSENEGTSSGPTKTSLNLSSQDENDKFPNNLMLANLFKNGFLNNGEGNSPLQPVKNIFGFVMDKLKSRLKTDEDKDEQQLNHRFPRKLFEHGKHALHSAKEKAESLAPVGIHRTLKLGPWSVNFDMGKP